jgi:hypothetical protein
VIAVDGGLGVVEGVTRYQSTGEVFGNVWLIRLDDGGRCTRYAEYWMQEE